MAPLDGDGERILVVEDDAQDQKLLIRLLDRAGYRCSAAADASEARRLVAGEQFDLILADVKLPGESGLQLVQHAMAEYPGIAALMVTGMDDPALANTAIEIGTYGYIIKPFTGNEILIGVKNALCRRKLQIENTAQRETLEQIVHARTTAIERSAKRLKLSREETVRRLSRAVEYRDEETGGHTERMSAYWPASSASTWSRSASRARCTTSGRWRCPTTSCCAPAPSRQRSARRWSATP
jgi:putative two-component system response regulator